MTKNNVFLPGSTPPYPGCKSAARDQHQFETARANAKQQWRKTRSPEVANELSDTLDKTIRRSDAQDRAKRQNQEETRCEKSNGSSGDQSSKVI